MENTIKVREAILEDAEFILESQVLMAQETEGLALDPALVNKGVRAVFEDPSKGRYLVAEESGERVATLFIVNEWSDWRNANVLWIHSVFVIASKRGKGIYKSMYHYVKRQVENDSSLAGIRLYVDKTNSKAIDVYKKLEMTDEHYRLFEWLKSP